MGGTLAPAYGIALRHLLTPEAARLLIYGGTYKAAQAKKLKAVDRTYRDKDDMFTKISLFAKEMAP